LTGIWRIDVAKHGKIFTHTCSWTKGFTLTVEEIAARLFSSTVEDEEAELTPPKGILTGILIRKNCLPVSDFRVLKPCRI
jgi:hypothetical protein